MSHLDSLLAVNAKCIHNVEHRFTVVPQVWVVLRQWMGKGLVGSSWICQHPAVLFDLGHSDPPGRVHHQHLTDQVLTILGHEKRDPEPSLSDSLSEGWQAGTIERKRTADKNVQHHTKALFRNVQTTVSYTANYKKYAIFLQLNILPKCPVEGPHTPFLQIPRELRKAGCHTTSTEPPQRCKSFQIRNLQETGRETQALN